MLNNKPFFYVLLLGLLFQLTENKLFAQRYRNKRKFEPSSTASLIMHSSKWVVGIKGSVNFTTALPEKFYTVVTPASGLGNGYEKEYDLSSRNVSPAIAIQLFYYPVRFLGFSVQPGFANYRFTYSSEMRWNIDELGNGPNYTRLQFEHDHRLNYFELPLITQLSVGNEQTRFFLQGGLVYGHLLTGYKYINGSEHKAYSDGVIVKPVSEEASLSSQINPNRWCYQIGGGISFDLFPVRLSLECNYKKSFDPLINPEERYSDQHLLLYYYDVMDDLKLGHLEFGLSLAIPLDHIHQVYDNRK
ncbi:hypothetical protein V6R21_22430 [Limibacter armeniacum]|uniref:hypothetical protein n=1 Tax=Limibacter armeniacum TaxID=466084 RepID=UPI002FE57650